MKYIVGLGNPDTQYEGTRHNIGRTIVESFAKKHDFEPFDFDKKINALVSEGKIGKEKVMLIMPETYMNKSGLALKKIITSKKKAADMVIVYDELDMALGVTKMAFGRGSGGHRGIESVIKSLNTRDFARFRVGISASTSTGKLKKPKGEDAVSRHVLGHFTKKEEPIVKKLVKRGVESLASVVEQGYIKTMNSVNGMKAIK